MVRRAYRAPLLGVGLAMLVGVLYASGARQASPPYAAAPQSPAYDANKLADKPVRARRASARKLSKLQDTHAHRAIVAAALLQALGAHRGYGQMDEPARLGR